MNARWTIQPAPDEKAGPQGSTALTAQEPGSPDSAY